MHVADVCLTPNSMWLDSETLKIFWCHVYTLDRAGNYTIRMLVLEVVMED